MTDRDRPTASPKPNSRKRVRLSDTPPLRERLKSLLVIFAARMVLLHAHMDSGADTPRISRPLRITCCTASASVMRAFRNSASSTIHFSAL
jgi:hypothetical protein